MCVICRDLLVVFNGHAHTLLITVLSKFQTKNPEISK